MWSGCQLIASLFASSSSRYGGRLHVPRALRVVDERRVAAPAVRIRVQVALGAEDAPALGKRLDHARVGLAHVQPGELAHAVVERAVGPHRVVDRHAVLGRHAEVVLAERRARVDDAGAVLEADEVAGEDRVAALAVVGQVVERRLVAHPEELLALHRGDGLVPLAEDAVGEGRGQDQLVAVLADAHVVRAGIDHERRVRQQRPRHRRPGEERDALLAVDREADVERRVLDLVVSERDLVRGQRRPAARAVRDDLVALVQEALLPDLLERPPDGLDVVVVEREVGLVGVDPERDPLRQPLPLVDVLEHRVAALLVELGHAVALDVVLVVEAELALDLELDRQAVAVPAALAVDLVAAHRLEAREDVLEDAAQHVVRDGRAVRRRRPLVEDELGAALAAAHRLVEDVALAPALEDLLLELGERLGRVDRPVAGHGAPDSRIRLDERGGCHRCGRIHRHCDVPAPGRGGPRRGRRRHRPGGGRAA